MKMTSAWLLLGVSFAHAHLTWENAKYDQRGCERRPIKVPKFVQDNYTPLQWEIYSDDDDLLPLMGACGYVFRARSKLDEKEVAIKINRFHDRGSIPGAEENTFPRECANSFRLKFASLRKKHDNIPKYIEVRTPRAGEKAVIVMERLASELPEECDRATFIKIIKGFLSGLCYAHQNRIIHGDLHTGNLMIGNDGHIKLIDFGGPSTSTIEGDRRKVRSVITELAKDYDNDYLKLVKHVKNLNLGAFEQGDITFDTLIKQVEEMFEKEPESESEDGSDSYRYEPKGFDADDVETPGCAAPGAPIISELGYGQPGASEPGCEGPGFRRRLIVLARILDAIHA